MTTVQVGRISYHSEVSAVGMTHLKRHEKMDGSLIWLQKLLFQLRQMVPWQGKEGYLTPPPPPPTQAEVTIPLLRFSGNSSN